MGKLPNANARMLRASTASLGRSASNNSKGELTASSLAAVVKLNSGDFDLLLKDVEDLYTFLDANHDGSLDFSEIANFLKTALEPNCTDSEVDIIFQSTDRGSDGRVSPPELHRALCSTPFRDHLRRLQQEAREQGEVMMKLGRSAVVTRGMLMERLHWRVQRDDSFCTLPLSLVVICLFTSLTVVHLQIWKRQRLQRGVEEWIRGYGQSYPGPYHREHVGDPTQKWEWLVSSGLTSVFTYCANDTSTGTPYCPFATHSALAGDVRLRQRRRDTVEPRTEWLLHAARAREHLRWRPGDYRGAAEASARALWTSGWADKADSLDLVFTSYNARVRMFAITEVRVAFQSTGFVVPNVVTHAVITEPYFELWTLALDVIYLFVLAFPTYVELRELLHSMRIRGAHEGCMDYWSFWNAVDWVGICMGWTNIAIWIVFCFATRSREIQALLEEQGSRRALARNVMSLDASALEAAEQQLRYLFSLFSALQITMGFNVASIMLKFFKAFQANPRLQLVTNTLIQASDELFHFLIVFLAIFLGFAVSGHILFGDDLVEFASFDRSMETSLRTLLGDFGWYSDQSVSDKGLGSGLPHCILALWFISYSTLVTLVILNMLLAIIMDHYSSLVKKVRSSVDAPTIWKQTANYFKRARDTKGFIPNFTMLCQLKDKDRPAHTGESVSRESLLEGFDGMKSEQADFLMSWLSSWASAKARAEAGEEGIVRLEEASSLLKGMASQVKVIALNGQLVANRLNEVSTDVGSRVDKLEARVRAVGSKVTELEGLAKERRHSSCSLRRFGSGVWERPSVRGGSLREAECGPAALRPGEGEAEPKLVSEQLPRVKRDAERTLLCSTIVSERRR